MSGALQELPLLHVNEKQRHGRRRYALEARGLTERFRACGLQTLPRLSGQATDVRVIDVRRQGQFLLLRVLLDFPLLPLDGGHAAIATYERLRERNGERYYADVAKMMPFAMAVMTVLLFLFMSGLYLDITDPVG